ncbi:hypothetical protein E2C01_095364 [Portunus trituberculatus]|uniref:Uncharacterized protein n=1 Tax=Portunus trituberculatus TaxID=210409 RepID=A0A5B7K3L5_PORTR|nr:hypothetical protein [Portunus trituberculatus]
MSQQCCQRASAAVKAVATHLYSTSTVGLPQSPQEQQFHSSQHSHTQNQHSQNIPNPARVQVMFPKVTREW